MNKIFALLLTALLTLTASAAKPSVYRINVGDFSTLTVIDGVGVDYYCRSDSAGWAVFVCEPQMASHIMFSNKKNRLSIQSDADEQPIKGLPRVTIYSTALAKAENSGDSLLHVRTTAPVQSFKVKQIGNGSIVVDSIDARSVDLGITAGNGSLKVSGRADKASVSNVSTGPIDASALTVAEVKATIFGTGDVHITPAHSLTVYGAGKGKIFYRTRPEKVANRSIGVKTATEDEK